MLVAVKSSFLHPIPKYLDVMRVPVVALSLVFVVAASLMFSVIFERKITFFSSQSGLLLSWSHTNFS